MAGCPSGETRTNRNTVTGPGVVAQSEGKTGVSEGQEFTERARPILWAYDGQYGSNRLRATGPECGLEGLDKI